MAAWLQVSLRTVVPFMLLAPVVITGLSVYILLIYVGQTHNTVGVVTTATIAGLVPAVVTFGVIRSSIVVAAGGAAAYIASAVIYNMSTDIPFLSLTTLWVAATIVGGFVALGFSLWGIDVVQSKIRGMSQRKAIEHTLAHVD